MQTVDRLLSKKVRAPCCTSLSEHSASHCTLPVDALQPTNACLAEEVWTAVSPAPFPPCMAISSGRIAPLWPQSSHTCTADSLSEARVLGGVGAGCHAVRRVSDSNLCVPWHCAAIHRRAGPALLELCRAVPEVARNVRCPTGEARITRCGHTQQDTSRARPRDVFVRDTGALYTSTSCRLGST